VGIALFIKHDMVTAERSFTNPGIQEADMIHVVFGLHMYQPPTQFPHILEKIKKESYEPLLRFILAHEKAFFNLDVCGSVLELAEKHGHQDLLALLREAHARKKINLVSTGCYHPIFPLIPAEMVERQIKLNNEVLQRVFGGVAHYQKPLGVFPPEMAFTPDITEPMKNTLALWTITEDIGYYDFYRESPPADEILKYNEMYIFLRSNMWSCKIAFDEPHGRQFAQDLKRGMRQWVGANTDCYVVLWMDLETFGHHHPNMIGHFLSPFLDSMNGEMKLSCPEELITVFKKRNRIVPPCSWSTNYQDFQYRNYFPLWNNPDNDFHKMWWHLARLAHEIISEDRNPVLLSLYDRAIYSCQTWQYAFNNKELAGLGLPYFREIVQNTDHPLKSDAIAAIRILERLLK